MNVIVIGLGSMGKRRIRLLKEYMNENGEKSSIQKIVGLDFNADRCRECEELYEIETYSSLEEACQNVNLDCAVISTAPLSHAKIIEECLNRNLHVFTELNLVSDQYEENISLAKGKNKVLFLSSTFLYRKEIQYIIEKVKKENFSGMYRYHIGQYLPEWHPWESYKNFFAGNKRSNGCREIFAVEMPWLVECFGKIKKIHVIHKKISELEIDYDDCYQVFLEHESGVVGNLTVDIVTPKTGRELEVWQEKFCITWNGTPDTLKEYSKDTNQMEEIALYDSVNHQEGYNRFVVENAYYDELVNYIQKIQGEEEALYSFEKDKEILEIIDRIEE